MKDTDTKLEYIERRAQGQSYGTIAKALNISKSTCAEWGRELNAEIANLRAEQLRELYDAHGMSKEARIARISGMLGRIDAALSERDFTDLPTSKLLDMKLQFERELKAEYTEPAPDLPAAYGANDALHLQEQIYARLSSGLIDDQRARSELELVRKLQTTYGDAHPFEFV